jgi:Uma2 family endonuclease
VSGINIFREASARLDYRIPDLTFVKAGREHVLHADGVRGDGPDAVLEIRSPEDETYEKFPFFAPLGVREVIVCDRDNKSSEIFRPGGSRYVPIDRDAGEWVMSEILRVRFRRIDRQPSRLSIEDVDDPAITVQI